MKKFIKSLAWALLALMAFVYSAAAATDQAIITVSRAPESPGRTAFHRGDYQQTIVVYQATNSGNVTGALSQIYGTVKGMNTLYAIVAGVPNQSSVSDGNFTIRFNTSEIPPGQTLKIVIKGDIDAMATEVSMNLTGFAGRFGAGYGVGSLSAIHAAVDLMSTPTLPNLSVRTLITASSPTITGFTVSGSDGHWYPVLVRAAGPALKKFGVANAATDPYLQVFDSSGNQVQNGGNDNWQGLEWAFGQVGAFPFDQGSNDAAVVIWVQPGNYTAQVKCFGADGVALVEIYQMPVYYGGKG